MKRANCRPHDRSRRIVVHGVVGGPNDGFFGIAGIARQDEENRRYGLE
jgi:hypothetical protein